MDQRHSDLTIRSIELIPVSIPMLRPIIWARGAIHSIDNVLVQLTLSDGTVGIADAPPRPTIYGETQQSIMAIIRDHLAPKLIGLDAFDNQGVWSVFDGIVANLTAKAALDMALYDARGKALGISCAQLMGGKARPQPVNWRLRLGSKKEMLAETEDMMSRYGFRALKVKCNDPARDIPLLKALRKQVGDDVEITIDCNQSYSSHMLLETAPKFEDLDIALIEEPIPARDAVGKRFVAERMRVPISGDDSCMTPDDVHDQLKIGGIRAIVIKCARTGYTPSRQIVDLARAWYTPVHNGSQADMQIGCIAAAHFACTYPAVHAHEFSSFLDGADHVIQQDVFIKDGLLHLPDGPGIGLTFDPAKVAKYRTDH